MEAWEESQGNNRHSQQCLHYSSIPAQGNSSQRADEYCSASNATATTNSEHAAGQAGAWMIRAVSQSQEDICRLAMPLSCEVAQQAMQAGTTAA